MVITDILSATALARMACLGVLFGLCALCFGSVLFGSLKIEKRGGLRPHGHGAPVAPPKDPSKTPSVFRHFFDAFLDRFLIDLGSIFPPNLPPKNDQNASKIDAKRHPILDFKF